MPFVNDNFRDTCEEEMKKLFPEYKKSPDGGASAFSTYYNARVMDALGQSILGKIRSLETSISEVQSQISSLRKKLTETDNLLKG
jgi:hypothetical protein